jgi:RNA polymerase sigma-70 factor (ECF subfamily)
MTLDELYDDYGERMFHFLALRLGSAEDAEDVLQETFCRLARTPLRWPLIRNPRAFVFKVARNESNRFLARRIGRQKVEGGNPDQLIRQPEVAMAQDPDPAAVLAPALAELPGEQKEVILLKVFQGFTFKEIAGICDVSVNTAASRYRYGLEKLRARLEGKL